MAEDDQRVKNSKPGSYDNEHVDGAGVMHVIVQERAPGRGGDLGPPRQVSANRGLAGSPWMRDAPQSGFARLILRIRSRISRLTLRRPRWRDRRRQ
jgi:hypothetical protein